VTLGLRSRQRLDTSVNVPGLAVGDVAVRDEKAGFCGAGAVGTPGAERVTMMSMMPSAPPASDSTVDTILTLPEQVDAMKMAEACRGTALAFLNDSDRWGKAELAMWLMGPYAQLTQYVSPFSRRRSGENAKPVPMLREIDARMVDRVIKNAREEVMATLERMSDAEGGASFAFTMLSAGYVARCEDRGHVAGWVPTSDARRLADRVLSLLAADYLTRPADYESQLVLCTQCNVVEFDPIGRVRGICRRHSSGFFAPRSRGQTLPYFPEGA
jgi:hypothetical protein